MDTCWLSSCFMSHVNWPSKIHKLNLHIQIELLWSDKYVKNNKQWRVTTFLFLLYVSIDDYWLLTLNGCNWHCGCLLWVTGHVWAAREFICGIKMCFIHHFTLFSCVCLFIYFWSFSVFCIYMWVYIYIYIYIYLIFI